MGINEGSPQMNSDGKKNEEAAANGRKMLCFCKTGVPTRLRLRQLFYPSSISFHQNSKASVSAQLAVKLIDFSCFSRSTSQ
ncbi:hypothetical protein E4U10_000844 [Claviceps purpurea]|nr:hypothetical protein E4U10_000844 [Claviceps purpurea]